MRCWLCVVAAAAPVVAQKSEPRLLYPIMIQGGPEQSVLTIPREHAARESFKKKNSPRALPELGWLWHRSLAHAASSFAPTLMRSSNSSTSFRPKTWARRVRRS